WGPRTRAGPRSPTRRGRTTRATSRTASAPATARPFAPDPRSRSARRPGFGRVVWRVGDRGGARHDRQDRLLEGEDPMFDVVDMAKDLGRADQELAVLLVLDVGFLGGVLERQPVAQG